MNITELAIYKKMFGGGTGGNTGGGNTGGGNTGNDGWIGDGNTHIWISLAEGRTSPMLGVCPKGTVTVDWGDGTTPDVLTGTSTSTEKVTPNHEYAKAGDYVITLTVDGEMGLSGNSDGSLLLRKAYGSSTLNKVYIASVQKVELSASVTNLVGRVLENCYALPSAIIPNSVTSIPNYSFSDCYNLRSATIPNSVTSIGNYAFRNCYNLSSIAILGSVMSVGTSAFMNCYTVHSFDFTKQTSVPTLSNTAAFQNIPTDCEIRVPAALYDEWIAATNWATYASYIKAV